jgi:hypothetical protein
MWVPLELCAVGKEDEDNRPRWLLGDLVEGKVRILLNFSRDGNQEDNLGQLAEKWGYTSGGGRFNTNLNQLAEQGYLKRFERHGKRYLKITFRGEVAILPLLLPRLLFLFTLVVAMALFTVSLPAAIGGLAVPAWTVATMGAVLFVFAVVGLRMIGRLDKLLLKRE